MLRPELSDSIKKIATTTRCVRVGIKLACKDWNTGLIAQLRQEYCRLSGLLIRLVC